MSATAFAIPFALSSKGTIATTQNPNVIAEKRVEALIGTYPGERVMQPNYGVNLPGFLFNPDIIETTDLLANEIDTAVSRWEPSISLASVNPIVTQADVGISQVNVEFTLSNDPTVTPTLVATVEVGGRVVNN